MAVTVSSKGQVTLPAAARERIGIRAGTQLEFIVRGDDRMEVVKVAGSVRELKGVLGKPARKLTLAQLDAALATGARRGIR